MRFFHVVIYVSLVLLALTIGYYSKQNDWSLISGFYSKVESKIKKTLNLPSDLEAHISSINSVHMTMNGKLYEMPDNHWESGGALTLWNDQILAMNNLGQVYYLNKEKSKLAKVSIEPPKNGRTDYEKISTTDKYVNYTHKPSTIRFNDIEHIAYENYNRLVLSYTYFNVEKECFGTRLSYVDLPETNNIGEIEISAADWSVLFDTSPCIMLDPDWTALDGIMAGGRIRFSKPNSIILASGEYHHDGAHTYDIGIQSDDTSYGKVLKINLSTGNSETLSKGHRNLQGLAIDDKDQVWTTEQAVRGGDELNFIKAGENYGWPLETLGTLYSGLPIPTAVDYGRHERFEKPVYAWLPSAGISSLEVVRGIDSSWDGDFLAGSLSSSDYGHSLFRIRVINEQAIFAERIYIGARVRYVQQSGPDEVALWTDSNQLIVFNVRRREDSLAETKRLLAEKYPEKLASKTLSRITQCAQCHSFEQFENNVGPSLNGVFERKIASSSYSTYSDVLKSKSGAWTDGNLREFLRDTQEFAKGSSMPSQGINNEKELEAMIFVLKNIKPENNELFYD